MACYNFDASISRIEDNYLETIEKKFTDQLLKRGKIFLSTGLRNIQYSPSILQYFSTKLAEDIKSLEAENLNSTTFFVEIKPVHSEILNPNPIKVSVQCVDVKNQKKPNTTVYVGIFYSWRSEEVSDKFLNLPFLFCAGSQKYSTLINGLFENYFGCYIRPIVFSQHDFRWLMALIMEKVDESTKDIELVYQIEHSDLKVNFTIPFNNLKEIWTDIHEENRSEITYEEVVRLHATFEEHILETYGFDLSHFHLKRFSVPDYIIIDVSGKIHVYKTEILDLILRFLKNGESF